MLEPPLDHTVPIAAAPVRSSRLAALGRGMDRSIALLAGLGFASQLIVAAMVPLVPLFALGLGASPVLIGLMVSVSAVAAAAGQVLGGYLADRTGPRRLLPSGMIAYGLGSLLTAAASSAVPIVAYRALTGLGSGAYIVGERLYIRQAVDRVRLAFANGLIEAAGAVGLIVGPLLGGAVAAVTDMQTTFVVFGVASAVVAIPALLLPARTRHDSAAAADELVHDPIGRRGMAVLFLANTAFVAGYGSFITVFSPYADEVLHWTTAEIGLAFSVFGLGVVTLGPYLGGIADRVGRRTVAAGGVIPIIAFTLALILPAPPVVLYLLAFAAGGGVAAFTSAWYALLSVAAGGPQGGRAFGLVAGISSIGTVAGALAAGQLWQSVDITAGMSVTVVTMALAGIIMGAYP